jgi:hypothetical protein
MVFDRVGTSSDRVGDHGAGARTEAAFSADADIDAIRPELTRSEREGLKVYDDREVS